jgi:hypothetical protein
MSDVAPPVAPNEKAAERDAIITDALLRQDTHLCASCCRSRLPATYTRGGHS